MKRVGKNLREKRNSIYSLERNLFIQGTMNTASFKVSSHSPYVQGNSDVQFQQNNAQSYITHRISMKCLV